MKNNIRSNFDMLRAYEVQLWRLKTVVHVRELPLSRKNGFGPAVTHLTAKTVLPDLGCQ